MAMGAHHSNPVIQMLRVQASWLFSLYKELSANVYLMIHSFAISLLLGDHYDCNNSLPFSSQFLKPSFSAFLVLLIVCGNLDFFFLVII